MKKNNETKKAIANNKKAFFDYEILERFEAGLALSGSEVKSIRVGKISLKEGFIKIIKGEAWLFNVHISSLPTTNQNYALEEKRSRKLLLHKKEILKLDTKVNLNGLTIVPLKVYFNARNLCKVEIGLAKGKKLHDKRESLKTKDAKRSMDRALKDWANR